LLQHRRVTEFNCFNDHNQQSNPRNHVRSTGIWWGHRGWTC
jgi:hypothetical protein